MSKRLIWHQHGWDGRVCGSPGDNVECQTNRRIAKTFDLNLEDQLAGKRWRPTSYFLLSDRDELIPPATPTTRYEDGRKVTVRQYRLPCWDGVNTYGPSPFDYRPPTRGNQYAEKRSKGATRWSDLPTPKLKFKAQDWNNLPARTFIATPYGQMFEGQSGRIPDEHVWIDDPEEERSRLNDYWSALEAERSLVMFYCTGRHPWEHLCRTLPIGVSLIKWIGPQKFHGRSGSPQSRYPVWQRPVHHGWPRTGFRIPWHLLGTEESNMLAEQLGSTELGQPMPSRDGDLVHGTQLLAFAERLLEVVQFCEAPDLLQAAGSTDWLETACSALRLERELRPGLSHLLGELSVGKSLYLAAELEAESADVPCDPIEFVLGDRPLPPTLVHREAEVARAREALATRSPYQKKWKLFLTQMHIPLDMFRRFSAVDADAVPFLRRVLEDPYLLVEHALPAASPEALVEPDPIHFPIVDSAIQDRPRTGEWVVSSAPSDPRRWQAKLYSTLKALAERKGDAVVPVAQLPRDLAEWLGAPEHPSDLAGPLVERLKLGSEDVVALSSLHSAEAEIAGALRTLQRRSKLRTATECKWTQGGVLAVHGHAGTGKTQFIKHLLSEKRIRSALGHMVLVTPTGRASTVLQSRLGTEANPETIHKLLQRRGWAKDGRPVRGLGRTSVDTVIVDESSMVDSETLAWMLRALDKRTLKRIIFTGDPSQLPPVGAGRPFADVLQWLRLEAPERIVELSVLHRNRGASSQQLLSALLANPLTVDDFLKSTSADGEEVELDYWQTGADLRVKLGELCRGHKMTAATLTHLHFISTTNGRIGGVEFLNHCLQLISGSRSSFTAQLRNGIASKGDKVVQTRNAWVWCLKKGGKDGFARNISNGAIGVVKWVAPKQTTGGKRRIQVSFPELDNSVCSYREQQAETQLALGYATTVHKAQGSEFQHVVAVIPWEVRALSRELLYTAFTRHRSKLTILLQQPTGKDGEAKLRRRRIVSTLSERSTMLGEFLRQ